MDETNAIMREALDHEASMCEMGRHSKKHAWRVCLQKPRLVSFAFAKPAAPLLDIVKWKVKAFAHPVPVSSHLHQACPQRQWQTILFEPLGI